MPYLFALPLIPNITLVIMQKIHTHVKHKHIVCASGGVFAWFCGKKRQIFRRFGCCRARLPAG